MVASSGTVEVKPHDLPPGDVASCVVKYVPGDPPGDTVRPNDVHVEISRLHGTLFGHPPWTSVYQDNNIPAGTDTVAKGITFPLTAPTEPDTYDIRVQWTLNGETVSERTGQFVVLAPPSKPFLHWLYQIWATIWSPLTISVLIIALVQLGICEFFCWLAGKKNCCNLANKFVNEVYGWLPDWLKYVLKKLFW